MLKHPLLPIGLAFAVGIGVGEFQPAPPAMAWAAAVLAAALALWKPAMLRGTLWCLAVMFAGAALHTLRIAPLNPNDLRNLAGDITQEAEVTGSLAQNPTITEFNSEGETNWHSSAVLEVEAIRLLQGTWQPAAGQLLISSRGRVSREFYQGRRVRVSGVLQPPPGPVAPGLFDYRAHLRQRGIHHQLRGSAEELQVLNKGPDEPWANRFIAWAQAALLRGLPVEDEMVRLTWAMLLGWRPGLTDEVSDTFMKSGTMHVFAISGLHIGLLTATLLALFRSCGLQRSACGLAILPLIWAYTAATGWQASAVRASVMASVWIAGWVLRRPSNLMNSLFAAALLILLWDSRQLFQTSFQLSFMVVLCIALLLPVLEKLRPWPAKEIWIPRDHLPRWRRWAEWCGIKVYDNAAISLAAWLGSLPLIAGTFSMFTPVSLIANLLIVPLSWLALMAGMGSLLTAAWLPGAAELFNHAGWGFMSAMQWLSDHFIALPGAYRHVPAPPWYFHLLLYGSLVALSWPTASNRFRGWSTAGLGTLLGGWLAASHFVITPRLTVLPFEDGHAVFHRGRTPAQHLLVDCGRIRPAERVVTPFLHAQGIARLPRMALTHGDLGQIGGAEVIRTNFAVPQILVGPLPFRSPAYRDLMKAYEQTPGQAQTVQAGDAFGPWRVLHPAVGEAISQADDGALALLGDIRGTRCLLLSDLGRPGQNRLMEKNPPDALRADIVIVGKPEASEPLAEAVLAAIQPKLIIVADALYPAEARVSRRFQERLARHRIAVVYTRLSGTVTLEFRTHGWRARTMQGEIFDSRELRPLVAEPPTDNGGDE